MISQIHPTAIVSPEALIGPGAQIGAFAIVGAGAVLGTGVRIGPFSLIGPDENEITNVPQQGSVSLGDGTRVGAHCRISGNILVGPGSTILDNCRIRGTVTIGARAELYDGVVIGNSGQFPGRHGTDGRISIGEECVLRESVTVTLPVLTEQTTIGNGTYLMARTQVDHDSCLGRNVKTGTGVTLGGSVQVGDYAYLGMNAVVHQGIVVGGYSMIGMNGAVTRHVPPYAVLIQQRFTRLNRRGLELGGCEPAALAAIANFYEQGAKTMDRNALGKWVGPLDEFFALIGDSKFRQLVTVQ